MGHLYYLLKGSESITEERQKEYESDDGKECYKVLSSGYNVTMVPLNSQQQRLLAQDLNPTTFHRKVEGLLRSHPSQRNS